MTRRSEATVFRTMLCPGILFFLSVLAGAEELTQEIILKALQGSPPEMEVLEIAESEPTAFEFKIGESVVKAEEGDFVFDGFRFKAPAAPEKDMVWYFNAPETWGQWYILPSEGEFKRGFKNWTDADVLYENFDKVGAKNRLRILQSLEGGYFEAGREYVMWFHRLSEDGADMDPRLTGVIHFVEPKGEEETRDHEDYERALGLVPQGPSAQIENLGSRGGKVLLDRAFFTPGYAANRIDSLFFSIRQTKQFRGGFFVKMQISVPPCKSEPSLIDIEKKYGPPDFVRSTTEKKKIGYDIEEEPAVVTHYYDYFGLEVLEGDPKQTVQRVVSQAHDFSVLRPKVSKEEKTFGKISMENLTVFHDGKEEAGRVYYFLEGGKDAIVINEPPAGKYTRGVEELEYHGDGKWDQRYFYEDGTLARHFKLSENVREGIGEGFYEDGKPSFRAEYQDGVLHGELVKFDRDGTESERMEYREGKPVEE